MRRDIVVIWKMICTQTVRVCIVAANERKDNQAEKIVGSNRQKNV